MSVIAQLTAHALAVEIRNRARELGFDLTGIASAEPSRRREYLRRWLNDGQAGEMQYLNARVEEREDPNRYMPGARSIICVAVNYHVPLEPPAEADRPFHGRIARYALGDDYHDWMKDRLHRLADWIRQIAPEAQTRACVDTAPVMEKELAQRAGIGWIGKNTCLIHREVGSWLLLGEILTTLDLPADDAESDHCGTCTRCIDACPTSALTAPYELDARRCVSYLTIEHRGAIEPELAVGIGDWLYGCDICQEVCPHNRRAPVATTTALGPRFPSGSLDAREVMNWTPEEYRARLKGSAMKRIKLPILQRNARIVAENASRRAQ